MGDKALGLHISDSCFTACTFCYHFFADAPQLVSAENVLRFAEYAHTERGYTKITVGGGDPLAREDMLAILRELKRIGYRKINLDTVGTPLLGPARTIFHGKKDVNYVNPAEFVGIVDMVGIPIDGHSNEGYSKLRRGRPRILDESIQCIHELAKHGLQVCVNTVLTAVNYEHIEEIYGVISILPISEWQLFQFIPRGPMAEQHAQHLSITSHQFKTAVDAIQMRHSASDSDRFRITPKSAALRSGTYLIVNAAGDAYVPTDHNSEIISLGNIQSMEGHKDIFAALDFVSKVEHRAHKLRELPVFCRHFRIQQGLSR